MLLGDVVELRHGPVREALAIARDPLSRIGEALGAGGEVLIVPGNHDHHWPSRGSSAGVARPPRLRWARILGRLAPGETLATILAGSPRREHAPHTRARGSATTVYAHARALLRSAHDGCPCSSAWAPG